MWMPRSLACRAAASALVDRDHGTMPNVIDLCSERPERAATIALFAYNRPEHTLRTLQALARNRLAEFSELVAFVDGPNRETDRERIEQVHRVIARVDKFRTVTVVGANVNQGCRQSLINGITSVLAEHDRVIVVEDDLNTSPYFLTFMNVCLDRYSDERAVFSVCGYSPPPYILKLPRAYPYDVYFSPRFSSWGWATWADRWRAYHGDRGAAHEVLNGGPLQWNFARAGTDLPWLLKLVQEGQLDTWDLDWTVAHFRHQALALTPVRSHVDNIGLDYSGTHTAPVRWLRVDPLDAGERLRLPPFPFVDRRIEAAVARTYHPPSLHERLAGRLHRLLSGQGRFRRPAFSSGNGRMTAGRSVVEMIASRTSTLWRPR
jgi:hypothetical protein